MVTTCPALAFERDSLGVSQFLTLRGQTQPASFSRQFKEYLGWDNAPAHTKIRRSGVILCCGPALGVVLSR